MRVTIDDSFQRICMAQSARMLRTGAGPRHVLCGRNLCSRILRPYGGRVRHEWMWQYVGDVRRTMCVTPNAPRKRRSVSEEIALAHRARVSETGRVVCVSSHPCLCVVEVEAVRVKGPFSVGQGARAKNVRLPQLGPRATRTGWQDRTACPPPTKRSRCRPTHRRLGHYADGRCLRDRKLLRACTHGFCQGAAPWPRPRQS